MNFSTRTRGRGTPRSMIAALALLFASSLFLAACGGGMGEGGTSSGSGATPETASLTVSAGGVSGALNALFDPNALFEPAVDVDSMTLDVATDAGFTALVVTGQAMTESVPDLGDWTTTISGLTVGVDHFFRAHAFDVEATLCPAACLPIAAPGVETFTGVTGAINITGAAGQVITINLDPNEPAGSRTYPAINTIVKTPDPVIIAGTTTITFNVVGTVGEEMTVTVTKDVGVGSSLGAPSWTTPFVSTGSDALSIDYTAGPTAGSPVQLALISNGKGNAIGVGIPVSVVAADAGTGVEFAPTIGSIPAVRTSGTGVVSFIADVTDNNSPFGDLTFLWTFAETPSPTTTLFTGTDAASATAGVNGAQTGVMVNYDQTKVGTVTLTVTDPVNSQVTTVDILVGPGNLVLPD